MPAYGWRGDLIGRAFADRRTAATALMRYASPAQAGYGATVSVAFMFGWKRQ